MGADLELEVNTGDVLRILRPDGEFGGKAIYALSSIYANYKLLFESGSQDFDWFSKLDSLTEKDPGLLSRIMYSGNWNYTEEDYDQFRICEGFQQEISQEEFVRTVREVANLWKPIDEVIDVVSELVEVLPNMGTETDWFSPQDTIEDFHGLLNTLILAKSRHGESIRLRGS